MRRFLSLAATAALLSITGTAWADKVAVLPFSSSNNVARPELKVARPELEHVRGWTREAVVKRGHTFATPDELVSAEAAVRDGVADTSQECVAAGKAAKAPWTLTARVERNDYYSAARLPDGATGEEGYTTYWLELEACQVETGRVESLSREVLATNAPMDIAEMVALLVRPEGLANAEIPWERNGVRERNGLSRPKPKPPAPPPPPPPPAAPPPPRPIYGAGHPFSVGASLGVSNALVRPDEARGPSWAMPLGGVVGYAPDAVPGLEVKANITGQLLGPRALEVSAGARYAVAPFRGLRLFVGPELLVGGLVALGADKTTRFLAHGSLFAAYGITENVQAEIAGDLATAFGGSGTLVLGGGTARIVVRF